VNTSWRIASVRCAALLSCALFGACSFDESGKIPCADSNQCPADFPLCQDGGCTDGSDSSPPRSTISTAGGSIRGTVSATTAPGQPVRVLTVPVVNRMEFSPGTKILLSGRIQQAPGSAALLPFSMRLLPYLTRPCTGRNAAFALPIVDIVISTSGIISPQKVSLPPAPSCVASVAGVAADNGILSPGDRLELFVVADSDLEAGLKLRFNAILWGAPVTNQ
jgi:hypothetical protein